MDTPSFKLPIFEGPLDLLLHLVQKHKIDLADIPIAEITTQYLAYIDEMARLDMEVTGEFLSMASHLLYIKSRALLPVSQEENEEDPREELAERLRIYRQVKAAAEKLGTMQFATVDNYFKAPENMENAPIENANMPIESLYHAFLRVCARLEEQAPPPVEAFHEIVKVPQVSLSLQIQYVSRLFQKKKRQAFYAVFSGMQYKNEVIATFLAVLHLVSRGKLMIEEENEEIFLVGGKQ